MKLQIVFRAMALAVLAPLISTPVLASNGSAEAPFRFYTVLDGLTQSNVVDIEQDQAGYLWFTTARGRGAREEASWPAAVRESNESNQSSGSE